MKGFSERKSAMPVLVQLRKNFLNEINFNFMF